jgi:hypothetical protein
MKVTFVKYVHRTRLEGHGILESCFAVLIICDGFFVCKANITGALATLHEIYMLLDVRKFKISKVIKITVIIMTVTMH